MATEWDFDVDDAFAYVILRTHRLLRRRFQRTMRRAGLALTQEQFVMLSKLAKRDGCTQGELVSATFDDRANVSRIVAGLEKQGYLTRCADPTDGRAVRVFITRPGRKVLAGVGRMVPEARAELYAGLDDNDLAALKRICSTLERNVLSSLE